MDYILLTVRFPDGNNFTSVTEVQVTPLATAEKYAEMMDKALIAGRTYIETGEGPAPEEDHRLSALDETVGNA